MGANAASDAAAALEGAAERKYRLSPGAHAELISLYADTAGEITRGLDAKDDGSLADS